METRKIVALVLLALILGGLAVYLAYMWYSTGRPGAYLEGTVKIRYQDGTEVILGSEDRQLFKILDYWNKRMNVLTYSGENLWSIDADINLRFRVDPPDKSVKAQYWILYWVEIDGIFFWGGRLYSSITGFVDTPISTYSTTKSFNKWNAKVMNPSISWSGIESFVDPFYREATSSVLVDLSSYISDPKSVTDALNGVPIVGSLADVLSAHLSAGEVRNGDNPLVVSWSMDAPDFYVRLKRSNFNGLSVHLGDFSIGAGEFARMWDGDSYRVAFKVGYFFRWQDVTGEWSEWKYGTVTIATFNMKVEAGQWYVLSVDVSGGVNIS